MINKTFICSTLLLSVLNLNGAMIRDNTNEIVLDTQTMLMWDDDYLNVKRETYTWIEAINLCENLTINGYSDWRLPNINELVTIIDNTTHEPAINNKFDSCANDIYWSSTTAITSASPNYKEAWKVDFNTSIVSTGNEKSTSAYVRCVRDL